MYERTWWTFQAQREANLERREAQMRDELLKEVSNCLAFLILLPVIVPVLIFCVSARTAKFLWGVVVKG